MAQKLYEISFAIAGKMAGNFGSTFSYASSRIQQLNNQVKTLNQEYKKGELTLEQYSAKQRQVAKQIDETRKAQELFNKAQQKTRDLASTVTHAAASSVRNTLTIGAGAAAVGGGLFVGSSLNKAMDFEAELKSIQALTGISNDELSKMMTLALQEGAATKYSALEAAQGIEELIKAGLDPATVAAGGLDAALNLATAGGLDLTEAATTMATSMNAFKKDGLSAAQVSDMLAGTANAAATDVHEIGYAIASAGNVADMAGLSFRDLNSAIGLMSNDGLKSGSDAGTSFKTMLMYLQPQTAKATQMFEQLGIGVGNANKFFENGKIKDLAGIAQVLHDALGNMSEQQRTGTLLDMFGTDGVKAASTLFKAGAQGVKDFQDQMAKVTALDVARQKMDSASGAVEQFRGAIETLQISALMPTLPLIKDLANSSADFATKYTPMITAAVQNAVNTAKNYLNDHFINNPDFHNLSTSAKIQFVFDDLMATFNNWYDASGNQFMTDIATRLTSALASGLDANVSSITQSALKIGGSMAAGMWDGLQAELAKHPLLAMLTSAAAASRFGPYAVGAAVFGTGIAAGNANANQEKLQDAKNVQAMQDINANTALLSQKSGIPAEMIGLMEANDPQHVIALMDQYGIPHHAKGGIFSQPHLGLVAEAGPEAIIPLNGSPRAKSIWQQAGESLGMGNSGVTIYAPFSPVINGGNKDEIIPALQEQQRSFQDQLQDAIHGQRRVSYGG